MDPGPAVCVNCTPGILVWRPLGASMLARQTFSIRGALDVKELVAEDNCREQLYNR